MGTDSREVKEAGAVEIQYRLFYFLFKHVRNVFVCVFCPKCMGIFCVFAY